jgi:hypothetical protein
MSSYLDFCIVPVSLGAGVICDGFEGAGVFFSARIVLSIFCNTYYGEKNECEGETNKIAR